MVASIVAVVQLADRIAGACKYYINTVRDYSKDLQLIVVEMSSLKIIFDSLKLLRDDDPDDSRTLQLLLGPDGPVANCRKYMEDLDSLLPPPGQSGASGSKMQKVQATLADLAWPFKSEKAKKTLDNIMQHKATINLALSGELLKDLRGVELKLEAACKALTGKVVAILLATSEA